MEYIFATYKQEGVVFSSRRPEEAAFHGRA